MRLLPRTPPAAVVLAAAGLALATLAAAETPAVALTQPNGATIPSPLGCSGGTTPSGLLAIFACQCQQAGTCNIGAPCASQSSCDNGQHGTCESTLWHAFNDNTCIPSNHGGIDPVADAAKASQTFHPTCALTFTVVSRGNAMFQNVFGWYNATGKAPAPSDLHPMLGCGDGTGKQVTLDLTKEPGWLGGDVGFFLMTPEAHGHAGTCASGNCCPSATRVQNGEGYVYTTQSGFDPDTQGSTPFIHVLAYDSKIWPQKFYFGMEDTYGGGDNDFADLVTSVEGVECSGAGQACNTGKQGICAFGVTECSNDQVSCTQLLQPSPEKCNGVDDDCDGKVDVGATCPDPGDVCVNGSCVHACGSLEFQCPSSTQCDTKSGLCVDPTCIGVACPADQVCNGGQCGTPCGWRRVPARAGVRRQRVPRSLPRRDVPRGAGVRRGRVHPRLRDVRRAHVRGAARVRGGVGRVRRSVVPQRMPERHLLQPRQVRRRLRRREVPGGPVVPERRVHRARRADAGRRHHARRPGRRRRRRGRRRRRRQRRSAAVHAAEERMRVWRGRRRGGRNGRARALRWRIRRGGRPPSSEARPKAGRQPPLKQGHVNVRLRARRRRATLTVCVRSPPSSAR